MHAESGAGRSRDPLVGLPELVFVTGASRSGTTLLSRVLGNHSRILSFSELHFFGDLCNPWTASVRRSEVALERLAAALSARQARGIWSRGHTRDDEARAREICGSLDPCDRTAFGVFAALCADAARSAGKSIACEQTPRNIFYAEPILTALPRARFVHIVRDPRAVVASQKNRWKLRRLGAKNVPVAETVRTWLNYHPLTMARLWKNATERAIDLQAHPRVLLLRFEDIVARPREVVGELCEFLDLGFEHAMLEVPQWGSSNIPHERDGGISSEVVDRWRLVLDTGEIDLIEDFTSRPMARFGYERIEHPPASARLLRLRHLIGYPFHLLGVLMANPRRAWIQLSALIRRRSTARAL